MRVMCVSAPVEPKIRVMNLDFAVNNLWWCTMAVRACVKGGGVSHLVNDCGGFRNKFTPNQKIRCCGVDRGHLNNHIILGVRFFLA